MKYARLRDGHLIDVYRVPEDFADVETLNRCLPGGGFFVVPDDAVHGALDNGDGTYTNPVSPPVVEPTAPEVIQPSKADLLAKVQELINAISVLPDEQ